MDFFFYAILILLIFLLPIAVRAEGYYRLEKRVLTLFIYLFGCRIARIKLYFTEEEIFLSLNGKKGNRIIPKNDTSKRMRISLDGLLAAIHIRTFELSLYAGGDPSALCMTLATLSTLLHEGARYLRRRNRLDACRIRILPCDKEERLAVNFSISLFTSPALVIYAVAHTIKGDKNAKGSYRNDNG